MEQVIHCSHGGIIFFLSCLLVIPVSIQENTYLGSECVFSKGNYTANSPFHSNLLVAFSKLTFHTNNTFSNVTTGLAGPDQVFALYECRNDVSDLQLCHHCVEDATEMLLQICPSKEAIVNYEECTVRYANRSIFSIMELVPTYSSCGEKAPEGGVMKRTLGPILERLIDEATSSHNSPKYFSTGNTSYHHYQRVYCLLQCTPDITEMECRECLVDAMNFMLLQCASENRLAGIHNGPSCQMRYDVVPFFNLSSSLPPSGSPSQALIPSTDVRKPSNGLPPLLSSTSVLVFFLLFSVYLQA